MLLVLGGSIWEEIVWDPAAAVSRAAVVVVIGVVLIWTCHLPIAFWGRAAILVALGATAAIIRVGTFGNLGLAAVWPVAAALFMFRVMIYLYDISTSKERPGWTRALSYFFLLPNAAVLLFPVIDFKTLWRSRYDEAALTIYHRGAGWIGRGVLQLLLYRFVDQIAPKPSWVASGTDLLQFVVTNSLLYLNVSGQFHIIIGLLLLFGFNLPETNHRYFLASSFTDYWRRVNIYWKDFMLKVFYYPAFFRLKRYGSTVALVAATLWVFFVTWLLHLYQRWWLTGSVSLTWPDALFWSMLGLLVLGNSLWELRRGRPRVLPSTRLHVAGAARLALRTAGTFACVCLLWSLWSTPTVTMWLGMWRHADRYTLAGGVVVLLAVMVAKIVMEVAPAYWTDRATGRMAWSPVAAPWRNVALYAAPLLGVLVLVQPAVRSRLEASQQYYVDRVFEVLETGDSIVASNGGAEVAYYQQLTSVDDGNRELVQTLVGRPLVAPDRGYSPTVPTRDFRLLELMPSVRVRAYETDFQTNRWGMRDAEYELGKRPGTIRIALMGSSHVMGWAVAQADVFETVLERRLNRELCPTDRCRFEILNFASFAYSPLSYLSVLEARARAFEPDFVLVIGHTMDSAFVNYSLRRAVLSGHAVTEPYLLNTLREARIVPRLRDGLAEKRLRPFESALTTWAYGRLAAEARAMGAVPIYAFVPIPNRDLPLTPARLRKIAEFTGAAGEGGHAVIDLTDVFQGHRAEALQTGRSVHTNAVGHSLIAEALYARLVADPRIDLAGRARSTAIVATDTGIARQPAQ
jgi:hypothetical protein